MANKKITDLTLRSDFDETCNIPVDDASQTWRVTGAQVAAFMRKLGYFSGYHDAAGAWSTTSNTQDDFTAGGTANLTERVSSDISVTTAASNLPGITFTPIAGAVYLIRAKVVGQITGSIGNNSAGSIFLVAGSDTLDDDQAFKPEPITVVLMGMNVQGIWEAPDASPITIKIQGASGGDPGYGFSLGYTTGTISWTVVRIK